MSATTSERLKCAWIRDPNVPAGQPAKGRLNCCDKTPESDFKPSQEIVRCGCGRVYSWQGWRMKNWEFHSVTVHLADGTSYQTNVNGARTHDEIRAYFVGAELNVGAGVADNVKRCVRVEIASP